VLGPKYRGLSGNDRPLTLWQPKISQCGHLPLGASPLRRKKESKKERKKERERERERGSKKDR